MRSDTRSSKTEKKKGGTRKKLKESSVGERKSSTTTSGEWYERAKASSTNNNLPHHPLSSAMNGRMEGRHYLTEETACDGSGFCWDMNMEGCGERSAYWDEEEVFNMPVLINSMAEGLLITPPALQTGFNWLPPETPFHFTLWAD